MLVAEKSASLSIAPKPSDNYTSYSRLQTLMLCPKKYEYRYELGLEGQDKSINLLFGTALHKLYQAWLQEEDQDIGEIFLGLLDEAGTEVNWGKVMPEDIFRWSAGFSSLLAEEPPPFKVLGTEAPFRIPIGEDRDLMGYIDAITEDVNGTITGIEFKTAARAYGKDQLEYSHQPTAYIWALSEMFPGRNIEFQYLVFTKTKIPKLLRYSVTRTQQQIQELGDLITYQDRISRLGVYPRIRSWMCTNCEYRNKCNGGE